MVTDVVPRAWEVLDLLDFLNVWSLEFQNLAPWVVHGLNFGSLGLSFHTMTGSNLDFFWFICMHTEDIASKWWSHKKTKRLVPDRNITI